MSLYVRVLNSFYTHRKTIRLRATIGDAAFWVPPRIWAYASENQPDGCLEHYSPEELAMLIAYTGDASVMHQALLNVRFLDSDPIRIHGWEEHNGYHSFYAERAKKAASARWSKRPSPTPPLTVPEKNVPDPSIASSMGDAVSLVTELHRTWQERTGLITIQSLFEREWFEFLKLGWRKNELELVIEHAKVLNRDREERYRIPLTLGKLIKDPADFANRLMEAQAWEKAGRPLDSKQPASAGPPKPKDWSNMTPQEQKELMRWVSS